MELFSGVAAAAVLVWFLKKYVFKEEKKKPGMKDLQPEESGLGLSGAAQVGRPKRFVYGEGEKKAD